MKALWGIFAIETEVKDKHFSGFVNANSQSSSQNQLL